MHGSGRVRGAVRFSIGAFLIALVVSWLLLYFDSIVQRRRAEQLILDLRSFPFATAGFPEVRDFMVSHGGKAIQRLPQTPPLTCTVHDCTFEVSVQHRLLRLPVDAGRTSELLYTTLVYSGIRPWGVFIRFEVLGGRLERTSTWIGQWKIGRFDGTNVLETIGYSVQTEQTSTPYSRSGDHSSDYVVGRPHVSGPPTEILEALLVQTPTAPMQRALDVNLRCLTSVLHGCRDFQELAPSAWADHERK